MGKSELLLIMSVSEPNVESLGLSMDLWNRLRHEWAVAVSKVQRDVSES